MKKKIKVGIMAKPIEQGTSGSGSHLSQLVAEISKNDFIDLYLVKYTPTPLNISNNIREIVIHKNPIIGSWQLYKYNFDIIHYSPLTIKSPIWIVGSKKIATIHGASDLDLKNGYGLVKYFHSRFIVPYLAKKMNGILTVSKTSRNFIIQEYGINSDKIGITYNAPSEAYHCLDGKYQQSIKSSFNINCQFIFHVSKFSERKNPWVLLESFKDVIGNFRFDHLELVIAGSGWDNDMVRQCIHKLGLIDRVKILGFVSNNQINTLFNAAEIFLFPSLYEGYGMPNIEAMSAGCPVVTTNVFAIPEIVNDGAILVKDPNSKSEISNEIIKILDNDSLRKDLIARGLIVSNKYKWSISAENAINMYYKCME
jgi:glycosyltransferase involved in cell wall biosynthesis